LACINALDDPIIPPKVLEETIKPLALSRPNILYVEQKYGGHLGFYEGGLFCPNPVSWLDRNVVNLADSLCHYLDSDKKDLATSDEEDFGTPMCTPKVRRNRAKRPSFVCKRKNHFSLRKKLKLSAII